MAIMKDYQHTWRYAQQMEFVTKPGHPGWIPAAQGDMATIQHLIEHMSGDTYPCEVKIKRFVSDAGFYFPWKSTILVGGRHGHLFCDLDDYATQHTAITPDNITRLAYVRYCTVSTPEDIEQGVLIRQYSFKGIIRHKGLCYQLEGEEPLWPDEAHAFVKHYLTRFAKANPTWHVDIWESGLGGSINQPDWDGDTLVVQLDYHDWEG